MNYFDQIEDYLNDNLTPLQRKAFDEEMEHNPDLALAVQHYPVTSTVYEVLRENSVKSKLEELQKLREAKNGVIKPGMIFRLKRLLAVAASIIVLFVSWTLWHANTEYSNASLVNTFVDLPNLSILRGETEAFSIYESARKAFIRGDHHTVTNLLSRISEKDELYLDGLYVLGFSYLETGQPGQAANTFQKIVAAGDFRKDRAEWHLMLSYISDNDIPAAEITLEAILADPNHIYHEKARNLELRLQSKWRTITYR